MPVRVLEPEPSFAEIDLAGDARIHHPLEGAIDRRAADAAIFLADEIDEVVGAEVPLLAEEHIDDEVALAGALAAGRAHAFDVDSLHARPRRGTASSGCARVIAAALFGGERRSAPARGRRVRVLDREAAAGHGVDEIDFRALEVADADRIDEQADAVRLEHLIGLAAVLLDHQSVLKARASAALHEHAQAAVLLLFFRQKLGDFGGCRRRHVNHVISPRALDGPSAQLYNTPLRAHDASPTISGSGHRRDGPKSQQFRPIWPLRWRCSSAWFG